MRDFVRVKRALLLLCAISAAFVSCDDFTRQNDTRTVGLQDPGVDATVKAALENGSVSEVVVRKDLLLFPVNAPNLVIAHSQEIHAIPQKNGSNTTDGKPVAAEVAEVNEYSLSQLVNDTDNDTTSQGIAVPASSFPNGPKNDSVLEPGKLLEIVSGFNLSNGVATEKVPLPSEVQNFSLPKHSIVDLLSKSLPQADDAPIMTESSTTEGPSSYYVVKRSVDDYDDDDEDDEGDDSQSNGSETTEDDDGESSDTELEKRSVESDEDDDSSGSKSDESTSSSSSTTESVKRSIDSGDDDEDSSSSTTESGSSSTTDIAKRSVDSDEDDSESDKTEESTLKTTTSTDSTKTKRSAEDDDDDSSSNSTEYYDHAE